LTQTLYNLGEQEHNFQTSLEDESYGKHTNIKDARSFKYVGAAEQIESLPNTIAPEDGDESPRETQLRVTITMGSVFEDENRIDRYIIEEASMYDAGGWHHFKNNTPTKAGGEAGAFYRKMKITSFPLNIQEIEFGGVSVVYERIGKKNKKIAVIIHTARVNFNKVKVRDWTQEQAQESLSRIYTEIFCSHISTNRKKLFFPPISGGRFSGKFKKKMPIMLRLASQQGFEKLSSDHQTQFRESEIYLCLYERSEFETYQEAGFLS